MTTTIAARPPHLGHIGGGKGGDNDDHPDDQIHTELGRQKQRQKNGCGEHHGDQGNAPEHFNESDRKNPDNGKLGPPAQRQQDPNGQGQHDSRQPHRDVQHEATELVGRNFFQAESADQQKRGDNRIRQRKPAQVAGVRHIFEKQRCHGRDQQHEGDVYPPGLFSRIESVQELPDALIQKYPACSGILAREPVRALERGIEKRPSNQGRNNQPNHVKAEERQASVQPRRQQIGAQPADHSDGRSRGRAIFNHLSLRSEESSSHRSTNAIRELYQFMNAEVARLRLRYTANQIATISME